MKTIPVGIKDIKHWRPEAYDDLVLSYEEYPEEDLSFQEYCELCCFYVGLGRLFMTNQDEHRVWEWDMLDCTLGIWRELNPNEWHWGEGRPD